MQKAGEDTGALRNALADTSVAAGASYVYRIKARNSAGLSKQSNDFEAQVAQAPAGQEPEPVDADATRDGAIDLGDLTSLSETRFPGHSIGGGDDQVDYFKFTLTRGSRQGQWNGRLRADSSSVHMRRWHAGDTGGVLECRAL